MTSEITRYRGVDMQVCVPDDWTEQAVIRFAEEQYPRASGWRVERAGEGPLGGGRRVPCAVRTGHVHIVLGAGTGE